MRQSSGLLLAFAKSSKFCCENVEPNMERRCNLHFSNTSLCASSLRVIGTVARDAPPAQDKKRAVLGDDHSATMCSLPPFGEDTAEANHAFKNKAIEHGSQSAFGGQSALREDLCQHSNHHRHCVYFIGSSTFQRDHS